MTCKQCKYIDRCMSEASFLGQVFDPNYDGEHGCREFDTFTNADLIREMSDEELAEFIRRMVDGSNTHEVACYGCIYYGTHHSDPENKGTDLYKCDGCRSEGIGLDVLKWLRLPAREVHKGEGGSDGEGG